MPRVDTDNRREDIQILRAVCVAGVVLFHLGLAPSGFLGVDVFFTISGYVVMQSLSRRHEEGVRSFYSRRIGRLFPPLLMVMLGVVLVSIFWEPFGLRQIRTGKYVTLSLASVANIGYWAEESSYFALDVKKDLTLHTWSLHGEEWSKAKNLLDKAATKSGHDAASARGVVLRTEVNFTAAMPAAD